MKCKFPIRVPYYKDVNAPKGYKIVPCGKCVDCRKQLSNNWTFRLLCQMDLSRNNLFVTLTYSNDNVPTCSYNGVIYLSLNEQHLRHFLKKFRDDCRYKYHKVTGLDKSIAKCPMRYFAIGDYGETTLRPHYHILIFDSPYTRVELLNYLTDNWQFGQFRVDIASSAHTSYICKYMTSQNINYPEVVVKPFRLMSRGLGLDKTFDFLDDYLNGLSAFQVGSFRSALPAYMRKLIDDYVYSDENDKTLPSWKSNVGKMRFKKYTDYIRNSHTHGTSRYYYDNIEKGSYLERALSINKSKQNLIK